MTSPSKIYSKADLFASSSCKKDERSCNKDKTTEFKASTTEFKASATEVKASATGVKASTAGVKTFLSLKNCKEVPGCTLFVVRTYT